MLGSEAMASKRAMRRRICGVKRRFVSQHLAIAAIMRLRHKRNCFLDTLQPYRCRFCHGFHFGHRPGTAKLLVRKIGFPVA
jgi:hypothetical protein